MDKNIYFKFREQRYNNWYKYLKIKQAKSNNTNIISL